MPGISIVQDESRPDPLSVDAALESLLFFDGYGVEGHHDGDRTFVASTGYEGYPVRSLSLDGGTAVFEGELYDDAEVEGQVRDAASDLLHGRTDRVAEWALAQDGDFLLVTVDDGGTVRVATDPLGRLPAYVAAVGDATVLGRELKFFRELAGSLGDGLELDPLAVAQTLKFGYRLGTRTLFDGVERLPPASITTVDDGVEVQRYHVHRYDDHSRGDGDVGSNAEALVSRFEAACDGRASVADDAVVALSGGLDSRAVAAGFAGSDRTPRAVTFDRPDGSNEDEVRAARQVAEKLDVPWDSQVAAASDEHRERLLETKQGMNYLRLAFMLDFLEGVDAGRGEATLVTGDGGDKALPDLTPGTSLDSEDDVVEFVRSHNGIFDAAKAAEIAGITEERLVESVRERIRSYPESDFESLYVHFLVRERGMNWLFQGEDRNRYYYWSVSPFYAWPFFRAAMRVPPEQKAGGELQRRFLAELAPELVDVEYVNFGAPITSTEYRIKRRLYDTLDRYPGLRDAAVTLLKQFKGDPTVAGSSNARSVRRTIVDEGRIDDAFPGSGVEEVLGDLESYSTPELYHLSTIASLSERTADDRRSAATVRVPE